MGGNSEEALGAAEEGQMCLVARMAALTEDAQDAVKGGSEEGKLAVLHGRVMEAGSSARAFCEQLHRLREGTRGAVGGEKALPLVVLMEFDSRLALGDVSLASFVHD